MDIQSLASLLGIPVNLEFIQSGNHMAAVKLQDTLSIRLWTNVISVILTTARSVVLGLGVSETANFLEFSHTRVYREWCGKTNKKQKKSNEWQFHGNNSLLMRKVREDWADWFELTEMWFYANLNNYSLQLWQAKKHLNVARLQKQNTTLDSIFFLKLLKNKISLVLIGFAPIYFSITQSTWKNKYAVFVKDMIKWDQQLSIYLGD